MTAALLTPETLELHPGDVGHLDSASHAPGDRPCVHLLTARPPALLVFNRDAIANLNFQPRICPPPTPCIASRRGMILTLGFDKVGGRFIENRSHRAKHTVRHRFHYQLHPARWADSTSPDDQIIAAVLLAGGDR